jgi:hypothetical protein
MPFTGKSVANPVCSNSGTQVIVALSKALNALPIHAVGQQGKNFRNANGGYMKLGNFLSLPLAAFSRSSPI